MSRARVGGLLAVCCLVGAQAVHAQSGEAAEPPPKGPAEIIQRKARDSAKQPSLVERSKSGNTSAAEPGTGLPQQDPGTAKPGQGVPPAPAPGSGTQPGAAPEPSEQAAGADQGMPAGHPPMAGGEAEDDAPVGNDPHSGQDGAPPLARKPIATAEPSNSLAPGTIRVRVLDPQERPAANAELQLGTMNTDRTRNSTAARSGADGSYVFDKLATGDKQAYRVNVLYKGAKYSSTPFRLPGDQGYDVVVRQIDTTRDARELVLYVGATSLELRDERMKVVQQARLVNIGARTYVFPDEGQLVKLPPGIITFQGEEVMTDQHVREEKGVGMRVSGSVPPGEVTLTWGFDLPLDGTTMDLSLELPWTTFAYRVLADAVPGMRVEVDGLPPMEFHEDGGRRFLVTEVVKRVGEQPLRSLTIHIRDIPGPGPMRFIATFLAIAVLGYGAYLAYRKREQSASTNVLPDLKRQRETILQRARELEAERARGEIGPEFHANTLRDLEDELTAVLYEQRRASAQGSAAATSARK